MKKLTFFVLFLLFLGVQLTLNAQPNPTTTELTVEIGDVELCPGEEVDVPVYLKGMQSNYRPLSSIYFHIHVSDTSAFELVTSYWDPIRKMGTPIVTDVQPNLARRGSMGYNYCYELSGMSNYLPRFLFSWYDNSGGNLSYIADPDLPLFKIRVRSKQKRKAYLQFTPGQLYIAAGTAEKDKYKIVNKDTGWISSPKDPVVNAGPDSGFCTGAKIKLDWASGGVKYQWTPLHNVGSGVGTGLTSLTVRDPDFIPKKTYHYVYEVKITNERGCWAKDTVTYIAVPNTVWMEMAKDTLVTEGTSAYLTTKPTGSFPPFTVEWGPEDKVLDVTNTTTLTTPILTPTLFSVKITDRYGCSNQNVQRVNIIGDTMTGFIDPFPITRCGFGHNVDSIQLNAMLKGGSNNLYYYWYGYNIDNSPLVPYFERENDPDPWVLFYGRAVFVCEIYDWATGQWLILRDTIEVMPEQAIGKVSIGYDNAAFDGSLCEGSSLKFYTDFQIPGGTPKVKWFVNQMERGENRGESFTINNLKKGDLISYAVYSDLKCVMNSPKTSPVISPDIEYWRTPTVILSDNTKNDCEIPIYQANMQNVGETYNLTWLINNVPILVESKTSSNSEADAVSYSFAPKNYHDVISCMVDKISSRCHTLDTVKSVPINVNYYPFSKVEIKKIETSFSGNMLCSDSSFKVMVTNVENLGPFPTVRWMKYNSLTSKNEEIARYHTDLNEEAYNYTLLGANRDAHADYYKQGYPITFFYHTDDEYQFEVVDGDSIYCIIENYSNCFQDGAVQYDTSAKMPVEIYGISDAFVEISTDAAPAYCNDKEIKFIAKADHTGGLETYTWLLNDTILKGAIMDTLSLPNFSLDDKLKCVVSTSFKCVKGYPFTANAPDIYVSELPKIKMINDTIACEHSAITLNCSGNATKYEWFSQNQKVGEGASIEVLPTMRTTYVVKAFNADGCHISDTVLVATLPDSVVVAVLDLAETLPICTLHRLNFSSSVHNGGKHPKFTWFRNGVEVLMSDTTYKWSPIGLRHKDTVYYQVKSDFSTCRSNAVNSNKIVLEIYDSVKFNSISSSQVVCKNDSIKLWVKPTLAEKVYFYEWEYLLDKGGLSGVIASQDSSFWLTPQKTEKIRLKVSDGGVCPPKYTTIMLSHAVPIVVILDAIDASTGMEISPKICNGADSSKILFKASAEYAGSTAKYIFQRNGKSALISNSPRFETYVKAGEMVRVVVTTDTLTCNAKPFLSPMLAIKESDPIILSVSDDDTLCIGENILLSVSGARAFRWRSADANIIGTKDTLRVQPLTTSTYYVEAVSLPSCPKVKDSVKIFVGVPVSVRIQKNNDENWMICPGLQEKMVTAQANAVNASKNAVYTWRVNGVEVKSTESGEWTGELKPGEVLSCELVNDTLACEGSVYISNELSLVAIPEVNLKACESDTICVGESLELWAVAESVGNDLLGLSVLSSVGNDSLGLSGLSSVGNDSLGSSGLSSVGNDLLGSSGLGSVGNDSLGLSVLSSVGNDSLGSSGLGSVVPPKIEWVPNYKWYDLAHPNVVISTSDKLVITPLKKSTYKVVTEVHNLCTVVDKVMTVDVGVPVSVRIQKNNDENWFICPYEDSLMVSMTVIAENLSRNAYYIFKIGNKVLKQTTDAVFTRKLSRRDSVYCILVNDTLSCENSFYISDKVALDLYPTTEIKVVSAKQICLGDTVHLNVDGGFSYIWSPATSLNSATVANPIASPTKSTTYIVNSTDHLGCKYKDSVVVLVRTMADTIKLQVSASQLVLCEEMPVTFTSSVNFNTEVNWYVNGVYKEQGSSFSFLPNHNDSVFASVQLPLSCVANNPAKSNILKIQKYEIPTLTMRSDTNVCMGQSVYLYPYSFEGNPTFLWSPAAFLSDANILNPLATPTSSTYYKLTAYYHPNCKVMDSVFIQTNPLKMPILTLTLDVDSLCVGSEYNFRASGDNNYSYQWVVNKEVKYESESPLWSYFPSVGDSIYVKQSFGNACFVLPQISSQTIAPITLTLNLNAGTDEQMCLGDSVILRGSTNAHSFYWSPEQYLSTPYSVQTLAFPPKDFTYYFHGRTGACWALDSVDVKVIPLPSQPIVDNRSLCPEFADSSVILTVKNYSDENSYYWYEKGSDAILTIGSSYAAKVGDYQVAAVSNKGCKEEVKTFVKVGVHAPSKAILLISKKDIIEGESIQFVSLSQNASTYLWNFGDGSTSENKDVLFTYSTEGLYTVVLEVASDNNCRSYTQDTIRVRSTYTPPIIPNDPENYVFIPSAFAPTNATNPKDKVFAVYGLGIKTTFIKVFDYTGVEVFSSTALGATWDGTYKGKLLPTGNYQYRIDITYTTDKTELKEGSVTLIR